MAMAYANRMNTRIAFASAFAKEPSFCVSITADTGIPVSVAVFSIVCVMDFRIPVFLQNGPHR